MTTRTGTANGRTRTSRPNGAGTAKYALEGNYPTSWDNVIGQDKAKRQLMTAARAATKRGRPMAHTLIASGTPGIGKTTLALCVAAELGTNIKVVSGKIKMEQARILFAGMEDGDVLLLEECHQLVSTNKRDAEWLLHYMENGVLVGPRGPEEQPHVTIIGTTTDAGKLPATLLDRMSLKPVLVQYTNDEAAKIAAVMSHQVFGGAGLPLPSTANCYGLAAAANNNPRIIRGLLETLSDMAEVDETIYRKRGGYQLDLLLDDAGLTPDGLGAIAQRYLVVLHDEYQGEPAGSSALKERLREPGGLEHVERVLLDKDLILFTKRGRALTPTGIKRARELQGM